MRRRPRRYGRVFGPAPPPVTAFKWAFGHLIAAAGILETALALAALSARSRARHRDPRDARPRLRRHRAVGFARRCRAATWRSCCAAASPAPTRRSSFAPSDAAVPMAAAAPPPAACGIDTVEIARIERLIAETPVADLAKLFSVAGAGRRRRRPRTRREPCRALRRQGGLHQAVPARSRAGEDRGRRFLGRARQLRRAAGPAVRGCARAARPVPPSSRSRCR